jgi:membrane-bound ClpP family serine protease
MPDVPRWIGHVGLVLALLLCGTALAGQLWLAVLLMIPSFALVVLESRCERGLIGTRRGYSPSPSPGR